MGTSSMAIIGMPGTSGGGAAGNTGAVGYPSVLAIGPHAGALGHDHEGFMPLLDDEDPRSGGTVTCGSCAMVVLA